MLFRSAPIRARRIGKPRAADILQGMGGYIVKPRFFDMDKLKDYSSAPQEAFFVDDVWLSAQCRAEKFVIPSERSNSPVKQYVPRHKISSLGWVNRGSGGHANRHNSIMLRHFAKVWRVGGTKR